MTKKILRSFQLKLTNQANISALKIFLKLVAWKGKKPSTVLMSLIQEFNRKHKTQRILVYEKELLEYLTSKDLTITKTTLYEWRKAGYLEDGNSKFWSTNGSNVVYDRSKIYKLAKSRRKKYGY